MTAAEEHPSDFFLEVRNVTKTFGEFVALDDVSMAVRRGEFVSVLGPSGCGKTTLLRVVAGLEEQNGGSVWLDGRDVSREPVAGRRLGIVFQSYALFPNLSVLDNVMYGIRRSGAAGRRRRQRAKEMLDLVGLADQAPKYPAQLSGGQQQRVALARALAPEPALLLLDEPLSALDARVRTRLRIEIRKIQRALGVTTVMVTHDQEEALTMADRVLVMRDGRLMQFASPQRLYQRPENSFVAGFIGTMNFIPECRGKDHDRVGLGLYDVRTPAGAAADFIGREVTLAVRPEDLRVVRAGSRTEENVIRTKIHDVEFCGSLYRIHLQLLHKTGGAGNRRLIMDLQVESVEEMELAEGMELPVHLPPEKVLLFHDQALALSA
ncbi:MAG: ATP-binding cassette domain-containing protein [Deltaproteobacteria bacterium]|nr:ATP-binding cassette domain-containing protein [Candidatus Anaeroferrophillacea bacterium]